MSLCRTDGKRSDDVIVITWSKRKCLTWDVTIPDTCATSHANDTSSKTGAAADKVSTSKTAKYANLCQSHIFMPIAIETSGIWNKQSYDFIEDLSRKISSITNDNRETSFSFKDFPSLVRKGMRFASPTALKALFKMEQINIFYCPDLVFELYLMCPCINSNNKNKNFISSYSVYREPNTKCHQGMLV